MKISHKNGLLAGLALVGALIVPLGSPAAAQQDPDDDDIVPDFCLVDIETPWFDIKALCIGKKRD